jgi:hypothetical protein
MRVLGGRTPHWPLLLAGPRGGGCSACGRGFHDDLGLRVKVYSIVTLGYTLLSIAELKWPRVQLQVSYTPALILTSLHALIYFIRAWVDEGDALARAITLQAGSPALLPDPV